MTTLRFGRQHRTNCAATPPHVMSEVRISLPEDFQLDMRRVSSSEWPVSGILEAKNNSHDYKYDHSHGSRTVFARSIRSWSLHFQILFVIVSN